MVCTRPHPRPQEPEYANLTALLSLGLVELEVLNMRTLDPDKRYFNYWNGKRVRKAPELVTVWEFISQFPQSFWEIPFFRII